VPRTIVPAMSAIGTKRTSLLAPHMSAIGGKADIACSTARVEPGHLADILMVRKFALLSLSKWIGLA
jgi:hypothetical protein